MRTIKKIHEAEYRPIADLKTWSPLPSRTAQQIDPFLFLNHHGPQIYPPGNNGLPFGPHPHRGMETVTFILSGSIMHSDSGGHESIISAGGVQWMTAGKGVIHAEVSPDSFKKQGGELEILQLWLNLPSSLKMSPPSYRGLQKDEIPGILLDDGKVKISIISGRLGDTAGPIQSLTNVQMQIIELKAGGELEFKVPLELSIFFYVVRGNLEVNGSDVSALQLVEFNNDGEELKIHAGSDSLIISGQAKPINEPVVAQGPFVMNTEKEIVQAYEDYRQGKFGNVTM